MFSTRGDGRTLTSMSELRLSTVLTGRGPAAAILLSDDQVATLAAGKTFPVVVTVDGRSAQLRLARMGGENMIGFSKAARTALGLEINQEIDVTIAVDTAERTVDVPPALGEALSSDPALQNSFDALAYSKRKELARQIADAKQEETRHRRLAKIIADLRP